MILVSYLEDLIPWGYRILLSFEAVRTPMGDTFFEAVTHLGDEPVWIILIAVVYWCFDKELGKRLSFIYLTSSYVNMALKYSLAIPRPDDPWVTRIAAENNMFRLQPLGHETSPSFPSNHSQGVLVGWIFLANYVRKWWFWLLAFAIIVAVGISRMYLGVHFPQDIIGGWLTGYVFLRLWLALEPGFKNRLSRLPISWQLILILLLPLLFVIIWPQESASKILGAVAGLGFGYIIEGASIRFAVSGPVWKKIVRAVVGLVVVFAISKGSGLLTDTVETVFNAHLYCVTIWFAYVLTGLTTAAVVPKLLVMIKLSGVENPDP